LFAKGQPGTIDFVCLSLSVVLQHLKVDTCIQYSLELSTRNGDTQGTVADGCKSGEVVVGSLLFKCSQLSVERLKC
jgi:hypothetical protein